MVQAFLKANLYHLCSFIVINFALIVHMDHFLSFSLYRRMKLLEYVNNVTKKPALCEHAKTKAQISSAVIARLRSAFVFATYPLHLAATISSHGSHRSVSVEPDRKPQRQIFLATRIMNSCVNRNPQIRAEIKQFPD